MGESPNADVPRPDQPRPSFEGAFDAYYGQVLAYALRRVPGRAEADDVTAETFAVAWRRRDQIPNSTLPWLYSVAANVINNQRRSSRRRLRLRGKLAAQPPAFGRDPADALAERDAVAQAFRELSDGQRELLRLTCWEGLGPEDAAIALGCTPTAFRARLHRARLSLERQLGVVGREADVGRPSTPRTPLKETK